MTNAIGQDRSSFQPVTSWAGLDYGIVKATEGTGWEDPTFAANWANLKAEGKPRGAYHFFHPDISAVDQAHFFKNFVVAHGFEPGDSLWCDSELPAGNINSATRLFMDELKTVPGGMSQHPLGVYSDEYLAAQMGACGEFELWIAHPGAAPAMPIGPWKTWRYWQSGQRGVDTDQYNGTVEQLHAWLATFGWGGHTPPPNPNPTPPAISIPEDAVPQLNNGANAQTIVSFAAGTQTWISFGCDASHFSQPAPTLRVAMHSAQHGWNQIEDHFALPVNGKNHVSFTDADVDMVSVVRETSPDVPIGYNLSNPAAA